ncbi:hypothetical protein HK105_207681 [Polyrhizophydium stewartii]|uniref:Uncharacterized protein n=1 Tax=Polyrhizophydium stewartii TaxID=2732419 RepID=A0ABR4MZY5_9FUNG
MWALYTTHQKTYRANRASGRTWVAADDPVASDLTLRGAPILQPRGPEHQRRKPWTPTPAETTWEVLSLVAPSDSSRDTQVRRQVRDLERTYVQISTDAAAAPGAEHAAGITPLIDQTADAWQHLTHHQSAPAAIQRAIAHRHARQYPGGMAFLHGPRTIPDAEEHLLSLVGDPEFTVQGLDTRLDVEAQLRVLRAHEKHLVLARWREAWEAVRPPRPGWFAMRGAGFSSEMQRARAFLVDPQRQVAEIETRRALLDLYRTVRMDADMCAWDPDRV